jgi:small neutral amino acid transporter SnatA (MarC family)
VVRRLGAPRFRRRMTELESQLGVAPLAMPNIAPAGAITPTSEGALSDS